MKTTLKHIALGTLVFLLFTQFAMINNSFLGMYRYFEFGFKLELKVKKNNAFTSLIEGHGSFNKKKGKWKVEGENVILIYKKRYDKEPDTLKIKRLDNEIDSLGNYKKL